MRRSSFALGLILLASGCSSEPSDGAAVTPFTPGPSAAPPVPAPPAAPNTPNTPTGGTTTNVGAAGGAASGSGVGEGAPGEVALDPDEAPLDGALGAGNGAADAGSVAVVPEDPAAPEGPLEAPATPSTGCGSGTLTQGPASMTIRGAQADYTLRLPPGYSPSTPTPLVFGFHGRNRTHTDFEMVDASGIQTELASRYIMVYPKSPGGPGWDFDAEVPPSVEFFDALYAQVTASYCVDTSRVFAVGHSSGGYLSIILACRYGSLLRGIGSIAGARKEDMCTTEPVAGMFIHGAADRVVANAGGRAARDQLLARNGCQQATVPGTEPPCVAYQGCAEGFPVEWCEHTQPEYFENGVATNHGWPTFASRAVRTFFEALH